MVLFLLSWLLQCLLLLLCVAFFTLFERNVIGLFHIRVGPNNVSFVGLFQPLLDAFKLLTNQNLVPINANNLTYSVSPQFGLFIAIFIWSACPMFYLFLFNNYSLLIVFCISSVLVFSVLLSGWSSVSNYSLIGSLRCISQSISYESVFSTLLVCLVFISFSYSIRSFFSFSSLLILWVLPAWFICVLAETHRAPFDFSESESELVSGFNTEYSGAYFAFIFLSEYMILIFFSLISSHIFFSYFSVLSSMSIYIISLVILYVFIWVRITFCRFRYDKLIHFAWNSLLPVTLFIFLVYLCFL